MVHKILIESKHESKAKLWWGKRKAKKVLVGSPYEATLKMTNVGEEDFPGGFAKIRIIYPNSPICHDNSFPLQEIKIGKDAPLMKIKRSAVSKGYASFFGKIVAKDDKPVQLIAHNQILPENASFYDILIESKRDVYSYWALVISVITLLWSIFFYLFLR